MSAGKFLFKPVSVGALANFCTRRGDLHLGFTPAPSSKEGIEGHQKIYLKRGKDYQSELTLTGQWQDLQVRGRADGYDPTLARIEEIKTFRGRFDSIPDNKKAVQWAQAKLYAWMLCASEQREQLDVALVHLNIDTQEEHLESQIFSARELQQFFDSCCATYHAWLVQEAVHRQARDRALETLAFPFEGFRPGQRELAESVYKAVALGRRLCVEAPTGLGKTLATLFPSLKAMGTKGLDRLFYLTARTPGRALALDSLKHMGLQDFRVLEMTALEQVCLYPDRTCQGDSCPLACGFYDRLPAARQAAVNMGWLDQQALKTLAAEHDICPYFLSQEMAHWSDLVVGDYNYFFDVHAVLLSLVSVYDWQAVVLMDESHNLVDRARSMYSAGLDRKQLLVVKRTAPAPIKKALEALNRKLRTLSKPLPESTYQVIDQSPDGLLPSLQQVVQSVLTTAALPKAPPLEQALLEQFFQVLHFIDVLALFSSDYVFDLERDASLKRREVYQLRNLVPGPQLAQRYDKTHALIQFSATFRPWGYLQDILGHSKETGYSQVPPHFSSDQLRVFTSRSLSTRYADRKASLPALVDLVGRQVTDTPGNYLVYFSSFVYLSQFEQAFATQFPDLALQTQNRAMSGADRQQFLDRFHQPEPILALAVLGGIFGEGIDLVGDTLIGAFVVTLGLPQWNPINEQLKKRLQQRYGRGYQYAYLYPGLQKVVQAAGRVIRSQDDTGVVYLLDTRFNDPEIRHYLPAWWAIQSLD